ncbi:peptidoglycan DD-metalloendopeptidase family protein [Gordonia sp. (in: high G+C Gram-positive bacteria)]|uniref:peptidoglycan DD-metalloendopeptidase family protein n=1 Tax=Gordonia sp. (in: high G+C Gram-positive bacteria) TaxID=84139 RepID=UPI0033413613
MRYRPISPTIPVTSGFGPRWGSQHNGIDYGAPVGTPIYAAADGIVIEGRDRTGVQGFGSWIWIDCQQSAGVDLIYGHVKHAGILVRAGDHVKAGQQIGVSGNEGDTTGPHLHFEVWSPPGRQGGRAIDPAPWLAGAADPTKAKPSTPPTSPGGSLVAPPFKSISMLGSSHQPRTRSPINFLLHTEQGGGTNPLTDAERLARYCNNTGNGVSYHYALRAGRLVQMVPLNRASWSVLDANAYTVNLCFAGSYAEWTREQWIKNCRDDIRIAAYIAVRDCKALGIPLTVIAPPYQRGSGISDHAYVTRALGIGTHTDVGRFFPWDLFAADVRAFANPAPVPNLIDAEAWRAQKWIGKRLAAAGAAGESIIRQGGKEIGRFVAYEHGHIYWRSGADAAVAVPHADPAIPGSGLFETWGADYGYERGFGFPKLAHTVVTNGAVQTFDDGMLFRKNGAARGWRVHGRILEAYAAYRYEQGPLGWPVGDERAVAGTDNREQQFEHGRLVWSPTGVVALLDHVKAVA